MRVIISLFWLTPGVGTDRSRRQSLMHGRGERRSRITNEKCPIVCRKAAREKGGNWDYEGGSVFVIKSENKKRHVDSDRERPVVRAAGRLPGVV